MVILYICCIILLFYFFNKHGNGSLNHSADILLLSCIDYRLIDDIVYSLNRLGYINSYDQFILAGASLGYNNNNKWRDVCNDHIDIATKLHNIKKIYIIDHYDCGYYKQFYSKSELQQNEHALHVNNLIKSVDLMKNTYPGMFEYKVFIINLDGQLQEIKI